MTQHMTDQDTANVEIIDNALSLPAEVTIEAATMAAEDLGITVSEELAEVVASLSEMDSAGDDTDTDDDDTVWGFDSEA